MQKIIIRSTAVAVHYALFLGSRGAHVKYLTCFENKAILEIDMHLCKTPASHEAEKEANTTR